MRTIRLMSLLSLLSLWSLLTLTACGDPTYSAEITNEPKGAPPTMAAVTKYQNTVADAQTGRPIANATVTITNYPSGTAATRYDSAGNVSTTPIVTDSTGWFSTYLVPGLYNITVASGSVSREYQGVQVGPAAGSGSFSTAVTGADANPATITVKYAKVGNQVTLQFTSVGIIGSGTQMDCVQKVPAGYRPPLQLVAPVAVNTGFGAVIVATDGTISFASTASGAGFTQDNTYTVGSAAVTYLVD